MDALFVMISLVVLGLLFYAAVQIINSIPEVLLWLFEQRLKKRSLGKLVELALRLKKGRAFADAVAERISDSEVLLRVGREAQNESMKEAANERHCQLFGHRLNDKCVCSVCKQVVHDFRDEKGRTPKETSDFGEFACTHCSAVFSREYVPGCKDTCGSYACDDEGKIQYYSSQSGQGSSWLEDCSSYVPSSIRETIRYERQAIDSNSGGIK